jgi:hypothetical protein
MVLLLDMVNRPAEAMMTLVLIGLIGVLLRTEDWLRGQTSSGWETVARFRYEAQECRGK